MRILVFASRRIGAELIKYLEEIQAPIEKVILAYEEDINIIKTKYPTEVHNKSTQDNLIKSGNRYEWIINIWSHHILKKELLDLADNRLNAHPGLPEFNLGNDTAMWAIRKHLPIGVSLLEITTNVDYGDVYIQKEVKYEFPIKGKELHKLLMNNLIQLFKDNWLDIYNVKIKPHKPSMRGERFSRKQTNYDRIIESKEFIEWIHAHDFSPNTTAEIKYGTERYRLNIDKIPPDITIRRLIEKDIPQIIDIATSTFTHSKWNRSLTERWFISGFNSYPRNQYFVAEFDDKIIGYWLWTEHGGPRTESVMEIDQVAIKDKYKGIGVGYELGMQSLKIIEDWLKKEGRKIKTIYVTLSDKNVFARKLYEKMGLKEDLIIEHLYNGDELFMRKDL